MADLHCQACGRILKGRVHRKFCSPACRKRASREALNPAGGEASKTAVTLFGGCDSLDPRVTLSRPPAAASTAGSRTFRIFVDPTVITKAPARFEGEVIGCWFRPMHNAALWLLEHGLADRNDTVETWREGQERRATLRVAE